MLGVDFVDYFSSLLFLDYISPFNICILNICKSLYNICCKAGLLVLNSLNFCLSEKLFISPSVLNEIFAGYSNLGCRYFPFITSWQIGGETAETVADFVFLGSKITADGDCSHEIKRRLLLGRKVMTNLDSILKSRDITLSTKVHLVKAMVLPVVMYGCESWTVKKAEHRRIDALELWCWRRLLRVPWTARRSNQSILKEISPGCSLEGLMLKLKL